VGLPRETGGGSTDPWLGNENIRVEVDSLKDFADHIKAELEKNFRPSFTDGIQPMLQVQAPFGASEDNKEGRLFRVRHGENVGAISQMMGEVMRGMMALSTAAMSIQAEYLMGDAFAEAESDEVLNAFTGLDGQKTLQDYYDEPAEGGEQPTDPDTVPDEAKDPDNYKFDDETGDPGGAGSELHDEKDIGKPGDPGYYHVEGDDEDTQNECKWGTPDSAKPGNDD